MADGNMKRLAAIALCDSSDPTRLTSRELNEGWGSPADHDGCGGHLSTQVASMR